MKTERRMRGLPTWVLYTPRIFVLVTSSNSIVHNAMQRDRPNDTERQNRSNNARSASLVIKLYSAKVENKRFTERFIVSSVHVPHRRITSKTYHADIISMRGDTTRIGLKITHSPTRAPATPLLTQCQGRKVFQDLLAEGQWIR